MGNSKSNLAMVAIVVTAGLVFIGTGFQSKKDAKKPEQGLDIKVKREIEAAIRAQEQSTADLKAALGILGNTPAPIKVRGGSMTFFTTDHWQDLGGSKSFCSPVDDAGEIKFEGQTINVDNFPWKMKIFGTSPDSHHEITPVVKDYIRGEASPRGVLLTGNSSPCPDLSGPHSVTIEPIVAGPEPSFYPKDLNQSGNKKENKRFRDSSTDCNGDSVDGATGKGDRELCERMRKVDLVSGFPASETTPKQCPDGDCELLIGNRIP